MNIEELRLYCLSLHNSITEDFPFGDSTLVFRIGDKIFALLSLNTAEPWINLKCDPEKAIELRETYTFIAPGFHMNKKHWNTLYLNEDAQSQLIQSSIKHSFELVYASLPKSKKDAL